VPNVPEAQKSFWTHLMELLDDMSDVESRFDPFGDNVNVDARWCTICSKHTIGSEINLDTPDGTPR
jgi:hypothetical protein